MKVMKIKICLWLAAVPFLVNTPLHGDIDRPEVCTLHRNPSKQDLVTDAVCQIRESIVNERDLPQLGKVISGDICDLSDEDVDRYWNFVQLLRYGDIFMHKSYGEVGSVSCRFYFVGFEFTLYLLVNIENSSIVKVALYCNDTGKRYKLWKRDCNRSIADRTASESASD